MHRLILDVAVVGLGVLLGREPSQSILVNVDTQRIDAVDDHVDTQVILKSVNQVRLVKVLLDDALVVRLDNSIVTRQVNTATLTLIVRLYNESSLHILLFLFHYLLTKVLVVVWQAVTGRKEVEIIW